MWKRILVVSILGSFAVVALLAPGNAAGEAVQAAVPPPGGAPIDPHANPEPCVPPGNLPYFRPGNNATRGQTSKIVGNTFFPDCQTP